MVCDKVVCERRWVTKMVYDAEAAEEEAEEDKAAGYRIKNKNPTQRCGEKNNKHGNFTGKT
jgi:hypothetical protein